MAKKQDMGKTTWQAALSIYGKTVLCAIMSIFIYISVTAIFSGLTPVVGERVYPLDADGNYVLDENGNPVYEEIYYEDEEELVKTEPNSSASEIGGADAPTSTTKTQQMTVSIRGELSVGMQWGMNILIQLLTGTLLVVLLYSEVWSVGDKDANLVAFGHREHDAFRGLKIGALAIVPATLAYVAYVAVCVALPDKAEAYTSLYCWLNAPFMPIVNAVNTVESAVLEKVLMALPLLAVPAISCIAYVLGYRQISLAEKFMYKKKK